MSTERLAPVEVRLDGRTLHGVALRYGEQARDRPELFRSGRVPTDTGPGVDEPPA